MDPPNPVSTRCYIPELHSAVVQDANGKPIVSADIPVPEVRPGTILVRTLAVALMPADYKTGLAFPTPGAGIGMDFVGRVVKHGNEDDNTFHVGDVVCGTVPGSYPDQPWSGAFATFILAPTDLVLRVPDHMSPLDATGIGTPLLTCSMTLWGSLGSLGLKGTPTSPAAPEDSKLVLVYGGSTTCGTMAIQMLKLSGHQPITTCSPKNFDLVKSFGATKTFDYSLPGIESTIRKYTDGKLRHVLDCVTDKASVRCCYDALGRPGGRYTGLEHCPDEWKTRSVVKAEFIMATEAFGIDCRLGGPYYRTKSSEKHEKAVEMHQMYQKCLDMRQIRTHPLEIVGNTLDGILDGLERLKLGFVSGKRLAVVLPD